MITYLYWFLVLALAVVALWALGVGARRWRAGVIVAVVIGVVGTFAYFSYYQQIFVKRWGGVMTVTVPDGQYHMNLTWKDDNLWVENYDPATNTCIFREYSRGDLLQGKVIVKNCNPLKYAPPQ